MSEDEGCLSIQGVLLPVERAAKIAIEGQDEHGARVRYELEGPIRESPSTRATTSTAF